MRVIIIEYPILLLKKELDNKLKNMKRVIKETEKLIQYFKILQITATAKLIKIKYIHLILFKFFSFNNLKYE